MTGSEPVDREPCILAIDRVSSVAAGARLLDRLDLRIGRGERVAIIAESGRGKSLLAALALGLVSPLSGSVRLFGEDLAAVNDDRRRELRKRCGVTVQGGSLIGQLSVEQNLRLALGTRSGLAAHGRRRIDRLLLDFGIERSGSVAAGALSRGERRRVELARAFVREPAFVLLDEPLDGSAAQADSVERAIIRQVHARDRSMLLLTQDARHAARLATRLLWLERGQLADGATQAV